MLPSLCEFSMYAVHNALTSNQIRPERPAQTCQRSFTLTHTGTSSQPIKWMNKSLRHVRAISTHRTVVWTCVKTSPSLMLQHGASTSVQRSCMLQLHAGRDIIGLTLWRRDKFDFFPLTLTSPDCLFDQTAIQNSLTANLKIMLGWVWQWAKTSLQIRKD